MLGSSEIIIVLVLALLLFGTRLPKVARSLGQGVSEFKRGVKNLSDDVTTPSEEKTTKK